MVSLFNDLHSVRKQTAELKNNNHILENWSRKSPKWNFILVQQGLTQLLFSQCFVFRSSQVEDMFPPTNRMNVSDSNDEDLQSRWRSMNVNDSFISAGEIHWEKECQKTFFYCSIVHINCPFESKDWFKLHHFLRIPTALSFTLSVKRC